MTLRGGDTGCSLTAGEVLHEATGERRQWPTSELGMSDVSGMPRKLHNCNTQGGLTWKLGMNGAGGIRESLSLPLNLL